MGHSKYELWLVQLCHASVSEEECKIKSNKIDLCVHERNCSQHWGFTMVWFPYYFRWWQSRFLLCIAHTSRVSRSQDLWYSNVCKSHILGLGLVFKRSKNTSHAQICNMSLKILKNAINSENVQVLL